MNRKRYHVFEMMNVIERASVPNTYKSGKLPLELVLDSTGKLM